LRKRGNERRGKERLADNNKVEVAVPVK